MASNAKTIPRRLDANPGESRTSMTSFPMRRPTARADARASGEVCSALTSSRSFITGGGLKKCIPTTRAGLPEPAGDLGQRQRGGVGGQDGVRRGQLRQPTQELDLERELLRHRFDDEARVAERRPKGSGSRAGRALKLPPSSAAELSLAEEQRDPVAGLRDGALELGPIGIVEPGGIAGLRCQLGDALTHWFPPQRRQSDQARRRLSSWGGIEDRAGRKTVKAFGVDPSAPGNKLTLEGFDR